jgi:putative ABC transport system permease protein
MISLTKTLDIVRLGLKSLTVHKMRSLLSMLGIIGGVWGVIAMLAMNEGSSRQAEAAFRKLGSNNIIITSIEPPDEQSSAGGGGGGAKVFGLTRSDVAALRDNIPGVVRCAVARKVSKTAYRKAHKLPVTVTATEPIYRKVARIRIVAGRFLSAGDMLHSRPHAVITAALARTLFPVEDPLGKEVLLGNDSYVVVGVLEELPRALAEQGGNLDNQVLIPMSTARSRLSDYSFRWSQGSRIIQKVEVSQLVLQMTDEAAVLEGAKIARSLLKRKHEQQDYKITVPRELIAQQKEQKRLWSIMFVGIAAISLVVGGIGIMNIMLASVTERMREIGIRRALGAKRTDIAVQFLVEAMSLTALGGVVGIGLGLGVPYVLDRFLGLYAAIELPMLVLPLAMAMIVGVLSGLYPAVRAARLDPIVALRHE